MASNLHFSDSDPGDDSLAALFSSDPGADAPIHSYRVVTTDNGLKVGFFGYVGVNAEHVAPNKAPATFSAAGSPDEGKAEMILPKIYSDLQPIVDKLRMVEKVDLVVGLSHAGVNDSKKPETGEDYQVAANVAGIDVYGKPEALDEPMDQRAGDARVAQSGARRVGGEIAVGVHGSAKLLRSAEPRRAPIDQRVEVVGPVRFRSRNSRTND